METALHPPVTRVLLVEDCEVDYSTARRFLASGAGSNASLAWASSVAEALTLLQSQQFEVCLIDLHLPDGSGLEVVRWLTDECPQVAVVILTGDERPAADEEALIAGADYFLPKSEWSGQSLSRSMRYALAHRERVQAAWALHGKSTGEQNLLPICMDCKKIRDASDYWHALEAYLHLRVGLEFTHGYCPTCFQMRLAEVQEMLQPPAPVHPGHTEDPG